jgi:predicted ATPase/DNA-binding SARP family transcriptional activator
MLRFHTLGGLRIERDGQPLQLPTQKARDLLAYLLTFRDRTHPRPVLAGILWPDLSEEKARRRLSDTLWRVRLVLGDHILAHDECIWFNADLPCWLDVEQFHDSVSTESFDDALALYHGPFLDGLYHDWVFLERERLRSLYLETLTQLLEHHKQTGDYAAALGVAQRLVAVEPLHEAAHRELMQIYHLLGRDAEAVAQYHRYREILREEMDVAPAPETDALYDALRQRTPPHPRPVAHLPAPARRPAIDLNALPIVGRDAERAMLLVHLEAAASGRGSIVLVEGEPGIGKSRLAEELVAGARWRKIAATTARGEEATASSSYALLLAALTSLLTPLRLRQLTRLLDAGHLQAIAPLLPHITQHLPHSPPLPALPPSESHQRVHEALIAIVLGLARITPHLWVLEDLQWADAETLALIPALLPHLGDSRSLLLLTGRSAELRANPTVWTTLQAVDRIAPFPRYALTPLDADAVAQLVHHLLEAEVPTLANHLVEESDGIPLYVSECLKAWRDAGDLILREDGRWGWHGEVPTSLPLHLGETVIDHRLAQLSPGARDVLTTAAVIGTEVDFDLLASACAFFESSLRDPDAYLMASDELLRLGFLLETDADYRFSHEQVRRIVYHQLSLSQRQRIHHQVAQALEALLPLQSELLAHHYTAAQAREPAIHHLRRAAERARTLFAHQTARACYDRLLDLLSHPDDRPTGHDVLRDRAEVLGWIGDREAQGRDLAEMLDLAQALDDDARLAETLHRRSEFHRLQGRYQPAEEDALAALEIYRRLGDDRAQAALLAQLGWSIIYTADRGRAVGYFEEALPIYESLDDLEGQINCLSGLTNAAELTGDYVRALSLLQRNVALAEATGDPLRISRAMHNTGVVYYSLGDMKAAETHLRQALRLKETIGDRRSQALSHFYLGELATEGGDLETAHSHLDTALAMLREVRDRSWEGDTLAALGRLALLQDDPVAAGEYLRAAYSRRRELGEPAYAVLDLSYLAVAELALGDEARGWQHSQKAVAELEASLTEVEHPYHVYYNHYRVARAARRWAAARAALERAAHIVDEWTARIDDVELQEQFRSNNRIMRAIAEATASQPPPGCLRVRLARADAPTHRRPTPEETVTLIWTVDGGEEDTDIANREGKVALRRHRILRVLAEAEAAGGLPAVADLAGALDVSPRTIRADLTALRRQGHAAHTRGHRA